MAARALGLLTGGLVAGAAILVGAVGFLSTVGAAVGVVVGVARLVAGSIAP